MDTKKSDCTTGQYINVFHPYDNRNFDVYVMFSESSDIDELDFATILNEIEPIIETAWEENKTKEFVYDAIIDAILNLDLMNIDFTVIIQFWRFFDKTL